MIYLQTNSYNLEIAKVFGVLTAVFLKCIDDEILFQERNKLISEDKTISLSRAEIYARTALDDDKQIDIEFALQECGVLIVKPLKNVPNKNYYIFNQEQLIKIMVAEDPSEVLGTEKAKQFTKGARIEPLSKRQNRIIGLKKKITIEDPVVKQYLVDWIDAVYSRQKGGFLSPTGVTIAQEELIAYAKDNQEKQIAILKIAIKGCLRDLTWAIEQYEKQNPVGTRNFMEYNDKNVASINDVNEEETF